jgi:hypothetical protein
MKEEIQFFQGQLLLLPDNEFITIENRWPPFLPLQTLFIDSCRKTTSKVKWTDKKGP